MKGAIEFRCPTCGRYFARPEAEAGRRFTCGCQELLCVPRAPGGSPLCRNWKDRAAMATVYGGGGAVLAFFVAWILGAWPLAPLFMLGGLLVGGLGGEAGVNLMGRTMRQILNTRGYD